MDGDEKKKEPEEPKFKAFTGKGVSLNDVQPASGGVDTNSELYQTLAAEYGDDPEMIMGIIASMQTSEVSQLEVPEEPSEGAEGVINLQLRLPDGSKLQRRFLGTNTVGHVINFIKKSKQSFSNVKLITSFPKRVLEDPTLSLYSLKFGKNEALNVDAK